MPDPTPVPVVASTGLARLLDGATRTGTVVGVTPAAAYVHVPPGAGEPNPRVVALEAPGAVGLPCGLGLPASAAALPGGLRIGAPMRVGAGRLEVGSHMLAVARWRRARPPLPPVAARDLAGRAGGAAALLPDEDDPLAVRVVCLADDLAAAVRAADLPAAVAVVDALCGLGAGSTPSGDDVVAGLVAAGALLAAATTRADGPPAAWYRRLGQHAAAIAPARTTVLSAALLAHAARAEVAVPVARLLQALAGRGDVPGAMQRLRAVGHRSGTDLARGVLLAATVVAGGRQSVRAREAAHA